MSKPKVLVFAVADTTGASHKKLEAAGYEVLIGNPEWMIPGSSREEEVRGVAREIGANSTRDELERAFENIAMRKPKPPKTDQ